MMDNYDIQAVEISELAGWSVEKKLGNFIALIFYRYALSSAVIKNFN